MKNPNFDLLLSATKLLLPMLNELVFVGGCATGLLISDEALDGVRTTYDVDAIVEVASYAEYQSVADKLRGLGFHEDPREGAPICRWVQASVVLDVMPFDTEALGFSNRWYRAAMAASEMISLNSEIAIRLVTAPYFIATKLEAFKGRGKGDFSTSHDLEDMITIVDGRSSTLEEIALASEVRDYIAKNIKNLLKTASFLDALPGYLLPDAISQSRISIILQRLKEISNL
jgi:predicted nucleotidyltransferase